MIYRFPLLKSALAALMLLVLSAPLSLLPVPAYADGYQALFLTSNQSTLATHHDANLVNPWGDSFSPSGAHWVADNATGLSTLYNGSGQPEPLVVTIPPPAGQPGPSAPTGSVYNSTSGFSVGGSSSFFLFCTEDGTISGWGGGSQAILAVDNHATGAVYKGMAIAGNQLYVANFRSGKVEVYDSSFHPVTLAPGAFTDATILSDYAPFNVQAIGNQLYVTYAKQDAIKHDNLNGTGRGFVDVFDTNGVLKLRLQHGYWFNAPWGVALAPPTFGTFRNALLVGNFGSGWIAAFNPTTGVFWGFLRGPSSPSGVGAPISLPGLWAITFGNNGVAGSSANLYFAAGVNQEKDGAFGVISPL